MIEHERGDGVVTVVVRIALVLGVGVGEGAREGGGGSSWSEGRSSGNDHYRGDCGESGCGW